MDSAFRELLEQMLQADLQAQELWLADHLSCNLLYGAGLIVQPGPEGYTECGHCHSRLLVRRQSATVEGRLTYTTTYTVVPGE